MCIRDSTTYQTYARGRVAQDEGFQLSPAFDFFGDVLLLACLLYTSDAADERSSVDLGGRRIIKKKTSNHRQYVVTLRTDISSIESYH